MAKTAAIKRGFLNRAVVLNIVVLVCVLDATALAQRGRPRERVVPWERGVSIASRLLPDDEVVVVDRGEDVDPVQPDPRATISQAITYAARVWPVILVMTADRVTGRLSADESWVETVVEGTVQEALKSPRHLSSDDRIIIDYRGGGEVLVGRVRVKAGTPVRVRPQARYLMFLQTSSRSDRFPAGAALLIEDGKLFSLGPPERSSKSAFDGLTLDRVAKVIRASVRKDQK